MATSSNQIIDSTGGPGILQKNCKRGNPKHFNLIKGELRLFFMVSWEAEGAENIFGCTPFTCYTNKGTPRFWNTFGPASIILDTKDAVKINYDIPVTSATKLNEQNVWNRLI